MAASLRSSTCTSFKCKLSSQFIKHCSSLPNVIPKYSNNSSSKVCSKADSGDLKRIKSKPSFSSKTKRSRIMARLINSRPWSSDLEASLATTFAPESSLSQTTVLHTLRLIQTPSKALHFFHWAYRSGFTHTPQSYLLMLEILCQARNFNSARNFLFSIPKKSNGAVQVEDKHFNTLIRAFGEAGLFKESLKIFRTMKSIGVSPSVVTFNNLFQILFKRGRTGMVFELYDEMLKTYGVTPDLYSFNILIRGFCKNSMVDEAFRIFKELEKFNREPDVVTYNTIVDGLCRDGRVKIAHNVVRGMKNKGPHWSPNVVTYTTLIRGYCGKQEIHEALHIFEEMIRGGQKPNQITYNTLIQGLCEARMLDKVKEILDGCSGENGEFVPDTCTFNTLMNAHCNDGNLDGAMKIFEKMAELKVQPDSVTYSTLIGNLSEKGEFEKAEKLFQELFEKEILLRDDGGTPLVASYNTMFIYLSESGKTEMADRVFRQLLKRGKQDAPAFKTLITGHCREGAFRAAFDLMVVMLRRDFLPDVESFEVLIDGLLQMNEPVLAYKTLEMMLKSSHLPRASIFHHILAELVRKGCIGESFSFVNLMLEKKIRQNVNIATDAVKMLYKGGLKDKALDIVRSLYENGYLVNFEDIITFLCQQKKLPDAQQLMLFVTKNGQRFDIGVYDMLLNGLCKTRRVLEAFELFYELLEQGIHHPLNCLEDLKTALEAEGKLKEAQFVSNRMPNKFLLNGSFTASRVTKRSSDL